MTLQVTYLGAGAIGATELGVASDTTYTIPITVASDAWVVAIESAWRADSGTDPLFLASGIYADNGGEPGELLHPYAGQFASVVIDTTARWVTIPMGVYLAAGAYHIGVGFPVFSAAASLLMDTGGASGDGHTVDGNVNARLVDADYSSAVITATTSTYSLRAVLIEEVSSDLNIPVGQAGEVEIANPITPLITRQVTVGQASESELANSISPVMPRDVILGHATERELARIIIPLTGEQFRPTLICSISGVDVVCDVYWPGK